MAKRPKASVLDFVDLGADGYQIVQQRSMRRELESARRAQELGTAVTLSAIEGLYDLHIAVGHKIWEIDNKLDLLTQISWNISSYFERKEKHEEFVGIMRFYIHNTNRSLDEIDSYAEKYPEYALLEINRILSTIKKKDVRVEYFSQVSMEEMRLAQELIDRVHDTKHSLLARLGN